MPSLRRAIHFLVPAFLLVSAALFVPVAVAQDARQENPVIGTYAQATDWLDANRSSPQLPTVLETAIQTAPTMKAVDELVTEYLPLVQSPSDRAQILYRVGLIQELANRYSQARLAYARALEANPHLWDASLRRAALSIEEGDLSEAILILTRVVNQAPTRSLQRRAAALRIRAHLVGGDVRLAYTQAQALAGYAADADAPSADLVDPEVLLLLYEAALALDDADVAAWSRTALEERGDSLPETHLLAQADDDEIQFYPSPSRILGGIALEGRPTVSVRTESDGRSASTPEQQDTAAQDSTTAEPTVRGIQTGSFRDPENARYMAEDIRSLGFEATVVTAAVGEDTYYRVLVPLASGAQPADAQRTIVELKERGVEGFLVFNEPETSE